MVDSLGKFVGNDVVGYELFCPTLVTPQMLLIAALYLRVVDDGIDSRLTESPFQIVIALLAAAPSSGDDPGLSHSRHYTTVGTEMPSAFEAGDVAYLVQYRYGKYLPYAGNKHQPFIFRTILGDPERCLLQEPYLFGVEPDASEFLAHWKLDKRILKPQLYVFLDGPLDVVAAVLQYPMPIQLPSQRAVF